MLNLTRGFIKYTNELVGSFKRVNNNILFPIIPVQSQFSIKDEFEIQSSANRKKNFQITYHFKNKHDGKQNEYIKYNKNNINSRINLNKLDQLPINFGETHIYANAQNPSIRELAELLQQYDAYNDKYSVYRNLYQYALDRFIVAVEIAQPRANDQAIAAEDYHIVVMSKQLHRKIKKCNDSVPPKNYVVDISVMVQIKSKLGEIMRKSDDPEIVVMYNYLYRVY